MAYDFCGHPLHLTYANFTTKIWKLLLPSSYHNVCCIHSEFGILATICSAAAAWEGTTMFPQACTLSFQLSSSVSECKSQDDKGFRHSGFHSDGNRDAKGFSSRVWPKRTIEHSIIDHSDHSSFKSTSLKQFVARFGGKQEDACPPCLARRLNHSKLLELG